MNHHQRAIAMVQESMNKLKGKTMPGNEPDDMRTNETNEALEATPATDAEVIEFVKSLVPKSIDVTITKYDVSGMVCVSLWIERGDVER